MPRNRLYIQHVPQDKESEVEKPVVPAVPTDESSSSSDSEKGWVWPWDWISYQSHLWHREKHVSQIVHVSNAVRFVSVCFCVVCVVFQPL